MAATRKNVLAVLLSIMLAVQCFTIPTTSYAADSITTTKSIDSSTFTGLDDPELLEYLEDSVYEQAIAGLAAGEYFIENVQAKYLSKEYLQEVAYNSQSNIYFGYTLDELNEAYEGTRYVFTVEDGQTVTHAAEALDETWINEIITNVAVGSGVILLCVTVSTATGGAVPALAAPAVSMIFAMGAESAATIGLSTAALSGAVSGVVTQIQTGDVEEALQSAAVSASDGFKWGAIIGSITGGAGEAVALKGATTAGLTMSEAAMIQRESKWSIDTIKRIGSMEEYNVYKAAGLKETEINGMKVLTRSDIDWSLTDSAGRTNLQRVREGLSPLGSDGYAMEVHHIGQANETTYALLTRTEHRLGGNKSILHAKTSSEVDHGSTFTKEVKEIWNSLADLAEVA